jgi:Retinal pigment epithelial membrane protein
VYLQDPETLERRSIGSIAAASLGQPGWMHDFAVGQHHAVLVESPLFFDIPAVIANRVAPYQLAMWKPEEGTRVHVLPLDGSGKVGGTGQGTSQVLCLSIGFPCRVLSLSTEPEVPWYWGKDIRGCI